jgi:hypothetical protein
VLACPVLEASGADAPAGWLGAAAASLACDRAAILLGGRIERTLAPAELLRIPPHPAESSPEDPYGEPDARRRSLREARSRAQAVLDGSVRAASEGFAVTLVLKTPEGRELGRGAATRPLLHHAAGEALRELVSAEALPKAPRIDEAVARWLFVEDVDTALLFLNANEIQGEVTLATACQRLLPKRSMLAETAAQILDLRCKDVPDWPARPAPSLRRSSPGALAWSVLDMASRNPKAGLEQVSRELGSLRARERSLLGRAVLAVAEAAASHQPGDPERSRAAALVAVQLAPRMTLAWNTLAAHYTGSPVEIMRSYSAWHPRVGVSLPFGPLLLRLRYGSRFYLLRGAVDPDAGLLYGMALIDANRLEEARAIAARHAGSMQAFQDVRQYLLVRIETSEVRFGQAFDRARRLSLQPYRRGSGARQYGFWIAISLSEILGRARELADEWTLRALLGRKEPPVQGDAFELPLLVLCARASPSIANRCFDRMEAARKAHPESAWWPASQVYLEGARLRARGDVRGAVRAWRRLLNTVGMGLLATLPADDFEAAGEPELAARIDAERMSRPYFNGISPAHPGAARRAFRRRDYRKARELAALVIDKWSAADVPVPAVAEMRALLRQIPQR